MLQNYYCAGRVVKNWGKCIASRSYLRTQCTFQNLEMLFVELKLGGTFLIELVTELAEFFGQDRCTTVKNTCSKNPKGIIESSKSK